MNKFKVGDKVIATGCSTVHGLEDRVGIVVDTDAHGGGNYCYVKDGNSKWSISKSELKLIKENNMFKKEDLKPFMRVKCVDGTMNIVCQDNHNNFFITDGDEWCKIENDYFLINKAYGIIEVYDAPSIAWHYLNQKEYGDLLWKRDDKSEIKEELNRLEKRQLEDAEKIKELKEKL